MIPYGKHQINAQDVESVIDVLENQFLTQGNMVPKFEQALCEYTDAKYCTAVNSGTSGLHVAMLAIGVGAGDLVWTTPNSFAASANCARYCGADIDFVDIDPNTRNLSLDALKDKIASALETNRLPKAIVLVHFAGFSCEMRQVRAICREHSIFVVEDAAHALGGIYDDLPIGSCQYSDISVLSFHPVKSITSAEGGAVLTNDEELAKLILLYAKHGITRNEEWMTDKAEGDWYYQQLVLGFNYRMSDIHAALGISQLKRIDDFIRARRQIAENYFEHFQELPIKLPSKEGGNESAWHLFMIEVDAKYRKALYDYLKSHEIGVNVHYIPIHLHPYYQSLGFSRGDFPLAEQYYDGAISLPIYVDLSEQKQQYVVDKIKDFFDEHLSQPGKE